MLHACNKFVTISIKDKQIKSGIAISIYNFQLRFEPGTTEATTTRPPSCHHHHILRAHITAPCEIIVRKKNHKIKQMQKKKKKRIPIGVNPNLCIFIYT